MTPATTTSINGKTVYCALLMDGDISDIGLRACNVGDVQREQGAHAYCITPTWQIKEEATLNINNSARGLRINR